MPFSESKIKPTNFTPFHKGSKLTGLQYITVVYSQKIYKKKPLRAVGRRARRGTAPRVALVALRLVLSSSVRGSVSKLLPLVRIAAYPALS